MSVVHEFKKSLAMSHEASDLPMWEEMYRTAWPRMAAMIDHREDGYWQLAGIDRTVVLDSSKVIRIDEKIRGRSKTTGKVYEDITLEYISNDETGSPGWAAKPMEADYIAYVIAPLGKGYLLPVQQMQQAWGKYGKGWMSEFGTRSAKNRGYKTFFCPVPVRNLFAAMGEQLRLSFSPFEWDG